MSSIEGKFDGLCKTSASMTATRKPFPCPFKPKFARKLRSRGPTAWGLLAPSVERGAMEAVAVEAGITDRDG
jgi:hypothetical protein